jgi:sulfate adenylyltransferase subunit 2
MHQEELNKKRRQAVAMRLEGEKIADISTATGLSAPTIIAAHKKFKQGGWDAVDSQPRGRTAGKNQRLSTEQLNRFREIVLSPPEHGLWTIASLTDYLQDTLASSVSVRTVNRYLTELGMQPDNQLRLAQQNEKFATWFEHTYPGIVASARDSTLLWAHYNTLATSARDTLQSDTLQTEFSTATHQNNTNATAARISQPFSNTTSTRHSTPAQDTALLVTHTPRGKCCWLGGDPADAVGHLLEFAARAEKMTGGSVQLILSGLDVFNRSTIRDQVMPEISVYPHPLFDKQTDPETQPIAKPQPATAGAATSKKSTTEVVTAPMSTEVSAGITSDSNTTQLTESVSATTEYAAHQNTPKANTRPTKRDNRTDKTMSLTHLQRLEAESIHIMREVVAEADNPVMLYSIGKDSAVMLHLAMKAFYPAKPPFPLLHVDTGWKFQAMYTFRDKMVKDLGLRLLTHTNAEGVEQGVNPFTHGSALHTDIMKTEALRQALDKHGFDAAFGGARRDEEKSRAKERIFSFRTEQHRWDPKNQRPELWNLYNARKHKGESIRAFPLSNWTELDIWQYIHLEGIPIVPLYFAAERPVVVRDGTLIMVDDDRMPMNPGEVPMMRRVRFRTLGCYPLTGAIESDATTLPEIIQEMLLANTSERQGRMIDHDNAASMEKKKQEGYF